MAFIDSAHADHSTAGFYLRATASNSLGAGPESATVFTDAFIEVLFSISELRGLCFVVLSGEIWSFTGHVDVYAHAHVCVCSHADRSHYPFMRSRQLARKAFI